MTKEYQRKRECLENNKNAIVEEQMQNWTRRKRETEKTERQGERSGKEIRRSRVLVTGRKICIINAILTRSNQNEG